MAKQRKPPLPDHRSRRFVFVPFCLLCQAFQAPGIVKYNWSATITPVVEALLHHQVNLVQMPCPESSFGGYACGLSRAPAGLSFYGTEEYQKHCLALCQDLRDMALAIHGQGYRIDAVLGIENSPSCAINYLYSHQGMLKRYGVFTGTFKELSLESGLSLPFVGINRKAVGKGLRQLEELLEQGSDMVGNSV